MTGSNDWRVTISLADKVQADQVRRAFSRHEVDDDVRRRLGRNVVIGGSESQIFLYAGTEVAAREAEALAREVLTARGLQARFALHRWHPIEEEWESPEVAIPQTEAERQAEHRRLEESETAESVASGTAQWQVRAEFRAHREAVALARKLQGEGRTVVRRWKFVIAGANNEDDARELAEQIKQAAPPGAAVSAEHAGTRLPFIPF